MKKCSMKLPIEFRENSPRSVPLLIQEALDHVDEAEMILSRLHAQFEKYAVKHGHLRKY